MVNSGSLLEPQEKGILSLSAYLPERSDLLGSLFLKNPVEYTGPPISREKKGQQAGFATDKHAPGGGNISNCKKLIEISVR